MPNENKALSQIQAVLYDPSAVSCDFGNLHRAIVRAGQQPNVAKLMADARNAVGVIGGDKDKTQTYCQIVDLGGQMVQAVQEKDRKKAKALSQKIDQLQKRLGPEFVALINGLERIDPNSSDGREIASIIESLDRSCD